MQEKVLYSSLVPESRVLCVSNCQLRVLGVRFYGGKFYTLFLLFFTRFYLMLQILTDSVFLISI